MRYAVILNMQFDLVTQINAAGHLGIGMGTLLKPEETALRRFVDSNNSFTSLLTDSPLIVFSAKNDRHLFKAHKTALEFQVTSSAFFECHISADPTEQAKKILDQPMEDQLYIALMLHGEDSLVRECTKRFSLMKNAKKLEAV
jgi:hypothetical protein